MKQNGSAGVRNGSAGVRNGSAGVHVCNEMKQLKQIASNEEPGRKYQLERKQQQTSDGKDSRIV